MPISPTATSRNPNPNTDALLSSSQIWLEAKDIMSTDVVTIEPNRSMGQAADRMAGEGVSSIVVTADQEVIGILTEHDFLRAVVREGVRADKGIVQEFMTQPIQSISPHRSILDASRLMETQHIKRLPVLAKGKLVGIITQTDLIRALTHVGTLEDVAAIMSTSVQTISPDATVTEGAALMIKERISSLVVFADDRPVGMLTERDMLAKVTARHAVPSSLRVRDVMSYPVVTINRDCSVFGAARTMDERRVHRLVVVDEGKLAGIVTQTDIFRAAKQRLQMEESRGFELLQSADSCIFLLDSSGTVTYVNPAFLRLFEINDPSIFVNQPFLPECFWSNPRQRDYYARIWEQGLAEIEELDLQTARGRQVYVSITSTFIRDIHGQINGIQGLLRDITPRKVAEQATATAYAQLEKANRELKDMQSQIVQSEKLASIGHLAAGVAHEMNTPVGFVISNFQTLGKYVNQISQCITAYEDLAASVEAAPSPVIQEALAAVQEVRQRLKIDFVLEDVPGLIAESREGLDQVTAIIQNLRDFSRVDQAEKFDEYQLNSGIESTLLVAHHELQPDIEVNTQLGDIPPVPCHAGQINQVLLALVVNAAQALREQTDRADAGHITIKTNARESSVYCEISDDGPGIPQEQLKHIFEPFFTTKPLGKGTGLGLSAAYDIVANKHNGELLVDSIVGQGSRFTIRLPIVRPNSEVQHTG